MQTLLGYLDHSARHLDEDNDFSDGESILHLTRGTNCTTALASELVESINVAMGTPMATLIY